MEVTLFGIVMFLRYPLLSKELAPRQVTGFPFIEAGISTEEFQPEYLIINIVLTPSTKSILPLLLISRVPLKELPPMEVILLGIATFVRPRQFKNAESPMTVTLLGMTMLLRSEFP